MDPGGMLCRIYVKLHITMLRIKYRSFDSLGFREADISCIFHYKIMADIDISGTGPIWNPRARLAGL